jgi:hypothetical protein
MNKKHFPKLIVAIAVAAAFSPLTLSANADEIAEVGGMTSGLTNIESSVPPTDLSATVTKTESQTPPVDAAITSTTIEIAPEGSAVVAQATTASEVHLGSTTANKRKGRNVLSTIMGALGAFFFDISDTSILNGPGFVSP